MSRTAGKIVASIQPVTTIVDVLPSAIATHSGAMPRPTARRTITLRPMT